MLWLCSGHLTLADNSRIGTPKHVIKNKHMKQTTIIDLINLLIKEKKTNRKKLSEKMKLSKMAVTIFLSTKSNGRDNSVKNPFISTVIRYFEALCEDLVLTDKENTILDVKNSSITLNQLIERHGNVFIHTSVGTFELVRKY